MRACLLIALVACSSPASTPPPIVKSTAPEPAGPAPAFGWRDGAFAFERLPAVSSDGKTIVVPVVDHDNERGNANLALELRDREDRTLARRVVLAVADGDSMFDASGPTEDFQRRIADGNRWLEDQHRQLRLRRMISLQVGVPRVADGAHAGTDRIEVQLSQKRFAVARGPMSPPLFERPTPAAWLAPPDVGCDHDVRLQQTFIEVAHRLVVLVLAYPTSGLCAAPPDRTVVIAY